MYAEIAIMMRDLGVTVTAGARTCKGLLDSFDEQILQGGGPTNALGRQIILTIRTGDIDVTNGSQLSIAGALHVVRERYQIEDGMLTRLVCSRGAA